MQGRNTLGHLCTRTFYTPERKYAYTFLSREEKSFQSLDLL